MTITRGRTTGLMVALAVATGGCALAVEATDDPYTEDEPEQLSQGDKDNTNGVRVVNGLKALNGLSSLNGLLNQDGLSSLNGLLTNNGGVAATKGLKQLNALSTTAAMTGLATCKGKTVDKGKYVNCLGRADSTCKEADGLLSPTKGMMRTVEGIEMAKYLVRCALPPGRTIRIKSFDGTYVEMPGEIGLAASWETGTCDVACEEDVSSCLIALTNSEGAHVLLELTSQNPAVGMARSGGYDYQESAAFGNIFKANPEGYISGGRDYTSVTFAFARSTMQVSPTLRASPYNYAGCTSCKGYEGATMTFYGIRYSLAGPKCSEGPLVNGKGSFVECAGTGQTTRSWKRVMTVWRDVPAF